MTFRERLLPQPVVSLAIAVLWLMLASDVSGGQVLLAAALGLVIPIVTSAFWPDRLKRFRIGPALRLFFVVIYDIVAANLTVARVVLGNVDAIRSQFVDVPLETDDPYVATILGSIITLTPGTLTIDIDMEKRIIHIHGLDVPEQALLIEEIKTRYEAPLKEIFGC